MSITQISINQCTCDRCNYEWVTKTIPVTCANKKCRTPYWNKKNAAITHVMEVKEVVEKNTREATPVEAIEKKSELDGLRAIMEAVQIKPKAQPHPALPVYPVEDQPEFDDNNYLQYD